MTEKKEVDRWKWLYLIERDIRIVYDNFDQKTRVYRNGLCILCADGDTVSDPEVNIFIEKLQKEELEAIVNFL